MTERDRARIAYQLAERVYNHAKKALASAPKNRQFQFDVRLARDAFQRAGAAVEATSGGHITV